MFQPDLNLKTNEAIYQHITKNCRTQSSLSRVENHSVETKNYFDGNEMSDRCGTTFCMR